MTTENKLQVPQQYIDKSKTLVKVYDDFVFSGESLDKIITEMREILIDSGFSKTQAMQKISEDHRHLRGFSLNNIYKVLPKGDKQPYTKKEEQGQLEDSSSKNFYQTGKNDEPEDILQSKIPPEREPTIIPTAYDIKEAESETYQDGDNNSVTTNVYPTANTNDSEIEELKQQIKTLQQQNQELESKLSDHAFDVIKNTSNDIREGTYELPIKEKFIPLKWQYFITTNRIEITIDEPKAKRRGI